jgi:hypothetical protein
MPLNCNEGRITVFAVVSFTVTALSRTPHSPWLIWYCVWVWKFRYLGVPACSMNTVNIYMMLLCVINFFLIEGHQTYQAMSEQFVSGQGAVFVQWNGDPGTATCCRPHAHSLPVRTVVHALYWPWCNNIECHVTILHRLKKFAVA